MESFRAAFLGPSDRSNDSLPFRIELRRGTAPSAVGISEESDWEAEDMPSELAIVAASADVMELRSPTLVARECTLGAGGGMVGDDGCAAGISITLETENGEVTAGDLTWGDGTPARRAAS
jgi:hypothetical protein